MLRKVRLEHEAPETALDGIRRCPDLTFSWMCTDTRRWNGLKELPRVRVQAPVV